MKKIYSLFLVALLCLGLSAQITQVNDPLTYGGKIRGYAKNSSCVLVATDGGIFKTTDHGQSWTNSSQSFNSLSVKYNQIVNIGNDFYVRSNSNFSTDFFKSTDNGDTWNKLSFPSWSPQTIGRVGNTLFVVGANWNTGEGTLYSSTNGTDWTPKTVVWTSQSNNSNCELYSFNQDKIYLYYNNAYYYTADGTTLTPISATGLNSSNFSNSDNDIDGDALGNLYYKSDNNVYKYNFTTTSWTNISSGKIPADQQIMDYSVTDNAIFLSTMTQQIGLILYRSTDQGATFTAIQNPGVTIPMIGNIIEVSTSCFIGNGLYKELFISSNGGDTWTGYSNQFIASSSANLTQSGNTLLFTTENRGFVKSTNGSTWSEGNSGVPAFGDIAYFVKDVISVKDTLFAFIQPTPFSDDVQLYKSVNNGSSWNPCLIPTPYNTGKDYAFAGKSDSALFVTYYDSSTSSYPLIVTYNNGLSWLKPSSQNSSMRTNIKGPKNCVFAFYSSNDSWDDYTNVYRANSYGMSFSDLNMPNSMYNSYKIKRLETVRGDKAGPVMDFDISSNKAIFAIRENNNNNGVDKLYLYNITSSTWSEINTVGLPTNYLANCIKNISSNTWLLATNEGLYRSFDGGQSWTITHTDNGWYKGICVYSIQLIGTNVVLGTASSGIWTVNLTTGIVSPIQAGELSVYPVPADNALFVQIPIFNGKAATVSLSSLTGVQVMNTLVFEKNAQLDLQQFPAGTYVLTVDSDSHIYRKVIIKK